MKKSQFWVTLLYVIAIMAPYFVPAMNQIEPALFGFPFPLWWSILVVIVYNIFLYIWSKKVWLTYDNEKNGE